MTRGSESEVGVTVEIGTAMKGTRRKKINPTRRRKTRSISISISISITNLKVIVGIKSLTKRVGRMMKSSETETEIVLEKMVMMGIR